MPGAIVDLLQHPLLYLSTAYQFDHADLVMAAETHRRPPKARAAGHIKVSVSAIVRPRYVTLLCPFQQAKWEDLASMGVSGQRQVHARAARLRERHRVMSHEQHWSLRCPL